ncbi:MAG: hypothetical protein DCC75_04255 [Proteobacteria bacterium]|nr:MAG: hypothetical protein DCC75_04255 [Pseudomonadota bacterium]
MSIDQHEDVGNVLVEITCDLACACELLQFISEGQSRAVPEINWMVRGRIMQLDDRLATIAWNLRSTAARCSGKDGPSETKQVLAAQTYRWLSELQQAHADVEAIFNLQSPEMNRVLNRATKVMISLKDALSVHDYSLRGMMKKQPPQDSPPPRRESPPEKKLQVRLASSR